MELLFVIIVFLKLFIIICYKKILTLNIVDCSEISCTNAHGSVFNLKDKV